MRLLPLAILALLCLSAAFVNAEEVFDGSVSEATAPSTESLSEEYEEPEEVSAAASSASSDIVVSSTFSTHVDRKIPVNADSVMLVVVTNKGNQPYNVTYIGSTLHSILDYNFNIRNFTTYNVGVVLGPKEQISLEYLFKPDTRLEAADFTFSGWVVYNSTSNDQFRTSFYNGTIEVIDSSYFESEPKVIFTYVAFAAALVFFAVSQFSKSKDAAAKKQRQTEVGTKSIGEIDESFAPVESKKAKAQKKTQERS